MSGSRDKSPPSLSDAKKKLLEQRLKGRLGATRKRSDGLIKRPADSPSLASPGQRRLWLLHEANPESTNYHICQSIAFTDVSIDLELIRAAMDEVLRRHSALRTTFALQDDQLLQVVHEEMTCDMTHVEPDEAASLEEAVSIQLLFPFDLESGPLFRVVAGRAAGTTVVGFSFHHIVFDEWSAGIFFRELSTIYNALSKGIGYELPSLKFDYSDFSHTQIRQASSSELEQQLEYWREALANPPGPLSLATDHPYPAELTDTGSIEQIRVQGDLARRIRELSASAGFSGFPSFLVAFQILLGIYSRSDDILIGTPVANRRYRETGDMIGFFLNTLCLRQDLSIDFPVKKALENARKEYFEALANQDVPFDKVLQKTEFERVQGRHPLIQHMFVYQQEADVTPEVVLGEAKTRPKWIESRQAKFDLTLFVVEGPEHFDLMMEYRSCLFNPSSIYRMLERYAVLLESLVSDTNSSISKINYMTDEDRHQLDAFSRGPAMPETTESVLEGIFSRTSQSPAIVENGLNLTYAEMQSRISRLAQAIASQPGDSGGPIGVHIPRSADAIIALLAVQRLGRAYLPLDPDYPQERLRYMIEDSAVTLVISTGALAGSLDDLHSVRIVTEEEMISSTNEAPPLSAFTESGTAYVIYTSGSSGRPRGVMVHTRQLEHSTLARLHYYTELPGQFLLIPSLSFDSSVAGIFWTLATGGTLCLPDQDEIQDPEQLGSFIETHQVKSLLCVPTYYREILRLKRDTLRSLKMVIVAGESCPNSLLEAHYDKLPECSLFNEYGPTEATVWSTVHAFSKNGALTDKVPIGKPIPNGLIQLLDKWGRLMAPGLPGEICIGGPGVTPGYINRVEATARSFQEHPSIGRIYRSGDQGVWDQHGNLYFLGRLDDQVKIRGYRIETGEVEAGILSHPEVDAAAVVIHSHNGAPRRLVGFFECKATDPDNLARELPAHLANRLPGYMVPSRIIGLPKLPRLPNGKSDRQALLRILENQAGGPKRQTAFNLAVDNPELKTLIPILEDILGVEGINPEDNFFNLGGDSILAIQAVSRARKAGINFTVGQFLSAESFEKLPGASAPAFPAVQVDDNPVGQFPLSPIQAWFLGNEGIMPDRWNLSVLLDIHSKMGPEELQECVLKLIEHHDALRTSAQKSGNTWTLEILPFRDDLFALECIPCPIVQTDPASVIETTAQRLQSSMWLDQGELVKGALFHHQGSTENQLLLVIHHIAVDWVSWKILLEDLETLVAQSQAGRPLSLPAKSISFRKWVNALVDSSKGANLQNEIPFWQGQAYNQCPRIPLDLGVRENNLEASEAILSLEFTPEETGRILQTARKLGVSVQAVLYGALARSISQWCDGKAVLFDLEGHGREGSICELDTTRTVGWFTTQFPVVLHLGELINERSYFRFIQAQLEDVPNRGIGYGVLKYLGQENSMQLPEPDPEVTLNYLGKRALTGSEGLVSACEWSVGGDRDDRSLRTSLIEVNAWLSPDQLVAAFSYSRNIHKEATIAEVAGNARQFIQIATKAVLTEEEDKTVYPLTDAQSTLLAHHLLSREEDLGQIQLQVLLKGPIEEEYFRKTWEHLLMIYPVLRTTLHWENLSVPVQKVHEGIIWDIQFWDFSGQSGRDFSLELEKLLKKDANRPLELGDRACFRLYLIRASARRATLVWTCHHILLDGWSSTLILQRMVEIYNRLLRGETPEKETTPSFREYCEWISTRPVTRPSLFWKSRLSGVARSHLLTSRLRTSSAKANGEQEPVKETRQLKELDNNNLKSMAQNCRVSPFAILLSAWAIVLSDLMDSDTVITGVTVSGRNGRVPGEDETAGMFANSIPIVAHLDAASSFKDWCNRFYNDLQEYREYDYCSEKQIHQWTGIPKTSPLFDCLFIFANQPVERKTLSQRDFISIADIKGAFTSAYPLTIIFREWDKFFLDVVVDPSVLDPDLANYVTTRLQELFKQLLHSLDCPLQELRHTSHPFELASQDDSKSIEEILKGGTASGNALERQIQQAWQSVFEMESIGLEADFFEIGGNSLIAAHLIARLQKVLDRPVAIGSLFRAPTIRSMYELIKIESVRQATSDTEPLLVPINPSGDKVPLIMIHPLGGDVFQYHLLGRHMPPDQPLYAIQAPSKPFPDMDTMTEAYLGLVFDHFPDGRFILGGYCFGAGVAFEILQKMEERDIPMYPLLAIDFMYLNLIRFRPSYLLKLLREETLQSFIRRIRGWSSKIGRRIGRTFNSKGRPLEPVIEDFFELPELPDATREQIESYFFMLNARKPKAFHGDVALILSESVYSRNDKWVGWDRFTKGKLSREIVKVEHTLMMEQDEIAKVAKAIVKILEPINSAH